MKLLLDEQLPVKLKYRLQPEIDASTVRDEGWLGIRNGVLIRLAISAAFDIIITNDQSIAHQQSMTQLNIVLINLNQPSNRYEDVLPAIYRIKSWLLANEIQIHALKQKTNYLVFPVDFIG